MPLVADEAFSFHNNELYCEDLPLRSLARRFGTPLYVYSKADMVGRYRAIDAAFRGTPHTICYSVKASSNLTILSLLARQGAGFDVVSGGELARVESAARKTIKQVVFSGVGKTRAEIAFALKRGILLFNVESEQELEMLESVAKKLKKRPRIAFRVNPHVSAATHPYISTGLQQHKFGVPIGESLRLYQGAARSRCLQPIGVSVHIGSQINDLSAFGETMEKVASLIKELRVHKLPISMLDCGGGLGIDYTQDESVREFAERAKQYSRAILKPIQDLSLELILEPGRSIIARAGILLTRVVLTKQNGNKRFVITDAAMNDLIRPSLYQAHHRIQPISRHTNEQAKADIVGPICETGDFFARDRELGPIKADDLLAIRDVGAYGMTLASNYNSRPRAAEVLVDGKKAKLIRKRETITDLLKAER
jgi:diaminopimelate decarboxylase